MPRVARTRRFPAARRHGPAGVVFAAPSPDALDAPAVGTLISAFGLGVRLADAGLIGLGILALRQRRWSPGWAVLSLALGVFRLLVVTPVSLAAGFFSVASNVAISIAHVLTALIGVRAAALESTPQPAQARRIERPARLIRQIRRGRARTNQLCTPASIVARTEQSVPNGGGEEAEWLVYFYVSCEVDIAAVNPDFALSTDQVLPVS